MLLTLADLPFPTNGGKRFRSRVALEALAAVADVDVLVLADDEGSGAIELPASLVVARKALVGRPLRSAAGAAGEVLRRLLPWQVAVRDHEPARRALAAWAAEGPPDLAWFASVDHALELGPHVAARHVVVDADDIETEKLRSFLRLPVGTGLSTRRDRFQRRVELPLWARAQRAAVRRADRFVVASDLDAGRVGGGSSVRVVPNGYPDPGRPARLEPPADGARTRPPTLVLVAAYGYEPNIDAATFAVDAVLPLVRAQVPDARLQLVGREIERVATWGERPGVELVGPVADVAPYLAAADAVVAPIRYGGGTRLKVLEAFAHGVPVVSTALGCEGLGAGPEHLAVADGASAFAAACVAILRDPEPARRRAVAARALYEGRFTLAAAVEAGARRGARAAVMGDQTRRHWARRRVRRAGRTTTSAHRSRAAARRAGSSEAT